MEKNLRDTIKDTIRKHLKKKKGKVFGQCLTAVGWVGGTLPELYEKDGMIELSMADVADGGFVVGAALMKSRPIYVIRYQGFNWYNCPMIVNYACKSKEIWRIQCPIFIRSIAMEGGVGPVAGSSHHSLYYRMPGVKIASPMTPKEFKSVYKAYMNDNDVYYVSEHRGSYDNKLELKNIYRNKPDLVIFAISITRFNSLKAILKLFDEKVNVSFINILWIKPFLIPNQSYLDLKKSKYGGLVIDDDYTNGISKSIANDLTLKTGKKVFTLGLKDKTAGTGKNLDNIPPTEEEIVKFVKKIIAKNV
jgi:pyruvate/2-oxoglutarate/acetoin dehydrogenase E1 component